MSDSDDNKPVCKYGDKCYRKNAEHLKEFKHPKQQQKKRKHTDSEESDHDNADAAQPTTTTTTTTATSSSSGPVPKKARVGWSKSDCALKWEMKGTLLLANPTASLPPSSHIASFDLDGTLTDTLSGKTFAKNDNDWRLFDSCVPDKLRELHKDGFKIVIFSNQNGIGKGNTTVAAVKSKVNKLVDACGDVPFQVLMATEEDEFRKPATGMWDYFLQHCNGGVSVSKSDSFYCGDAAGRPAGWKAGAKKDFACGDRKFAHNVSLPFHTPDELFLKSDVAPFSWGSVVPEDVVEKSNAKHLADYSASSQEMIIMVGRAASGKSTFVKRFLEPKGYVRINQDTLKTESKCVKAAEAALEEGKSVVIDNTNPSKDKRSTFIAVAKDAQVPVRCFVMGTPEELCHHNNLFRQSTQGIKRVPRVAYNMFKSKFAVPSKSEGFSDIVEIPFVPRFDSDKDKQTFLQFTEISR